MNPRELFESQLNLIEEVIAFVCRRHHLYGDQREDFGSQVKLEIIDDDYSVLRKFQGRSSLRTYLITVIHRLFLDYQIQRWGRWRPSSKAKKLGVLAVQLETLLARDGYLLDEAIEILKTNYQVATSREDLTEIAAKLPPRRPRRFESNEQLEDVAGEDKAERTLVEHERDIMMRRIETSLEEVLRSFGSEDRLILKMRFEEGFTVAGIASALNLDQRSLYTRIEKALKKFRQALESKGIRGNQIAENLDWGKSAMEVNYRVDLGETPS